MPDEFIRKTPQGNRTSSKPVSLEPCRICKEERLFYVVIPERRLSGTIRKARYLSHIL